MEIGTIVRLRSGGPTMTVVGMSGASCICAWFRHSSAESVRTVTLPEAALERIEFSSLPDDDDSDLMMEESEPDY